MLVKIKFLVSMPGLATFDPDITKTGDRYGQGWSIGGGNVLQLVCDLTIAADNAKFGQTGPNVGSFRWRFTVQAILLERLATRKPKKSGL